MNIKHIILSLFNNVKVKFYWIIFKLFKYKPNVLSPEETINFIKKENVSIARFGDGEYYLMTNKGEIGFQEYSNSLKDGLSKCFKTRHPKLLICSFDFKTKWKPNNPAGKWLRRFVQSMYNEIEPLFDRSYRYGNTDISRFYNPSLYRYTDFNYLENIYIPLLKSLWDNKTIMIVEGIDTKMGLGNDLFDNCKKIRRIVCPPTNAFNSYDNIYDTIVKYHISDELTLIALGPTATILSTMLTINEGIQCIDIGHVDICYMWYLNKSKTMNKIEGKYVNEAVGNSETIKISTNSYDIKNYKKQIIATIENK